MIPYRVERAQAKVPPRASAWRLVGGMARGTYRRMRVREHYYRDVKPYWNYDYMPRATLRKWARDDLRRGLADNVVAVLAMVVGTLLSLWIHRGWW